MGHTALKQHLATMAGGKVLDVGTSEGGFVEQLADSLASYESILGIDTNAERIATARERIQRPTISFEVMDGGLLPLAAATFDTVTAAYSLHHLVDIRRVLEEMHRVLKPGGAFLILEMFQDHQNEMQLTSVYVHHWIAEVDMATGVHHQVTLTRQQILDCAKSLKLHSCESFEVLPENEDPHDPEQIQTLLTTCDRYTERIKHRPRLAALVKKGQLLKQRIADIGALSPTVLCFIGHK